jgi:type VI secretion system secreted protein VgrG
MSLIVASAADLHVRRFASREQISEPWALTVWARSPDPTLDLGSIAGQDASFETDAQGLGGAGGSRVWRGVCVFAQQLQGENNADSTYIFRLVPKLWLLGQRQNHRIFQHLSIPKIVDAILGEWGVAHAWKIDDSLYPPLEYRVQWGETDYAFCLRMLEEAGISFVFSEDGGEVIFRDRPEIEELKEGCPVKWVEQVALAAEGVSYVTSVGIGHEVRPGAFTYRDYDFRRPAFTLGAEAKKAPAPEDPYEQYHYGPGSMVIDHKRDTGETPVGDDRAFVRHVQSYGEQRAERSLAGERAGRRQVGFEANFLDAPPGTILSIAGHPHDEIVSSAKLLVTELTIECEEKASPRVLGRTAFASSPWKPRLATPRPRIRGVHTAVVVGPRGEEIAPDEYGRINIQFPWDREGSNNELSSCWVHVSQGWSGLGYGMMTLPRVGHEVLVDFLDGDPDRPMVVGRVYNAVRPVPYKLPEHGTQSGWKTDSTPGSGGFNEILYEDKKGDELVYLQAERNLRKLVKNDELITVGHDREKHTIANETDNTGNDRSEEVKGDRTESNGQSKIHVIREERRRLVQGNDVRRTQGAHMVMLEANHDHVVKGKQRERASQEVHLRIKGDRREHIDGQQSITVDEERHEKVKGDVAFQAGQVVHFAAGDAQAYQGGKTVTLKSGANFVHIDGSGITIVGSQVKINAGGSPGSASGAHPQEPEVPAEAEVPVPDLPTSPKVPEGPEGKNWIEIALVQEDDPQKSVPFARYKVELKDGTIVDGRLDASGKAMLQGIEAGTAKITFPDLDGGSWSA